MRRRHPVVRASCESRSSASAASLANDDSAPRSAPCRGRKSLGWATMAPSTPFRRAEMLDRLEAESFDVMVIGGGITGTGVALDAAARGLRTALVERDDF